MNVVIQEPLLETPQIDKLQTYTKAQLIELAGHQGRANLYLSECLKVFQKHLTREADEERLAIKDALLIIKRKLFGKSSERRPSSLSIRQSQKKAKKNGPRTTLPSLRHSDIPLVEEEIEYETLPHCKLCNTELEKMNLTEDSEMISVTEKTYFIKRQKRHKYKCRKCHGDIKTAPVPLRIKPGSLYSDEIAIDVAVSKYADHLPVERYVKIAERGGLKNIHPKTLIDQTHYLADTLQPVYEGIKEEVQSSSVLYADETPWKMLEGDDTQRWFLWGFFTPHSSFYEAHNTRAAYVAGNFLNNCKASHLLTDAYSGYAKSVRGTSIKNAYCWAHVRRRFIEAEPNWPLSTEAITLIGELYEVERHIRGKPPEEVLKTRKEKSEKIIKEIRNYLYKINPLPKSSLGKARKYTLDYWEGLTEFLINPYIPIDNNLAERALRGPVVGRKNYYGNHSKRGALTTQVLYSIIESCKLNNVEPQKYLRSTVFTLLNRNTAFTPKEYSRL